MSAELRFMSGVMYEMSFNVANTALRLIMDIYIISPIEFVFVCVIWVEYLVNCVVVAIFILIYRRYACTGILRKIQALSGKVSGYVM